MADEPRSLFVLTRLSDRSLPAHLRARGAALRESGLTTDAELFDQSLVPFEVPRVQVIKQAATLANQAQQSAARMMVLCVRLQMPGQLFDSRREDGDLDFGRTAVVLGARVGADNFPLAGGLERHQVYFLSLFPLFIRQGYQRAYS